MGAYTSDNVLLSNPKGTKGCHFFKTGISLLQKMYFVNLFSKKCKFAKKPLGTWLNPNVKGFLNLYLNITNARTNRQG
mgnify:CR=1 FL=1